MQDTALGLFCLCLSLMAMRLSNQSPFYSNIYEVFILQPIWTLISTLRLIEAQQQSKIFNPYPSLQQIYNVVILYNSSLTWLPKTFQYLGLQVLHWSYLYHKYGDIDYGITNDSFTFSLLGTLIIGVSLRRNEQISRIEFDNKTRKEFQRQKFINVLETIQDGVFFIKQQKEDQDLIFQNKSFKQMIQNLLQKYQDLQTKLMKSSMQISYYDSELNNPRELPGGKLYDLLGCMKLRHEFNHQVGAQITFADWIRKIREQDQNQQYNYYFKVEPIGVSLQVSVSYIWQDERILIVFKEISTLKKLQKIKNREQFTNIFINSTAHNIFTPINGLIGISQLIQKEVGHLPQALKYLHLMRKCIFDLYYCTQNILEHSKIRLKQFTTDLKEKSHQDIYSKVVNLFENDINQKNLQFNLNIQNKTSKILIDDERFSLILYNLLSNAIKHTEQVSVKDTGQGISANDCSELFNPFRKFKISNDNINQQGLGLGLMDGKKLRLDVHILHSDQSLLDLDENLEDIDAEYLWTDVFIPTGPLESRIAENPMMLTDRSATKNLKFKLQSSVSFNINTMRNKTSNISFANQLIQSETFKEILLTDESGPQKQILVVDDTVFNIEIIKIMLEQIFDLQCDVAFSGHQALQVVQKRVDQMRYAPQNVPMYNLILMDINMSGWDGVKTTKKIRKIYGQHFQNDNLIFAYTAIPESQFGNYVAKGFDGFIAKPLDLNKLRKILQRLQLIQNDNDINICTSFC
ncbi:multi-sensor hybrid histidine kinase [Stylonychia lemnae]|uniref:Multi-sensor hybrid histidine kinase n=1 Tax=Stylonychia lemnae TaxID=5949 RepID=A0A077ZPE5_STYLE|nr:multi-sensor hybrid histidine kinase [Stylonychia lemnae]|eukprot:CDW71304.1 multi-sensor hybrid histidine kinase [Stylonychia lemnae]